MSILSSCKDSWKFKNLILVPIPIVGLLAGGGTAWPLPKLFVGIKKIFKKTGHKRKKII
jgi:hypothetical protein